MQTKQPIESPRCGEYIQPQFGRTRVCSTTDSQCTACQLREAEMKIELLRMAAQEAVDHERAHAEKCEIEPPSWVGNLEHALSVFA